MPGVEQLLTDLIRLQEASIRLQKLSISLQAETIAYQRSVATATGETSNLDKLVMKSVVGIRKTIERVEKGRALPK